MNKMGGIYFKGGGVGISHWLAIEILKGVYSLYPLVIFSKRHITL